MRFGNGLGKRSSFISQLQSLPVVRQQLQLPVQETSASVRIQTDPGRAKYNSRSWASYSKGRTKQWQEQKPKCPQGNAKYSKRITNVKNLIKQSKVSERSWNETTKSSQRHATRASRYTPKRSETQKYYKKKRKERNVQKKATNAKTHLKWSNISPKCQSGTTNWPRRHEKMSRINKKVSQKEPKETRKGPHRETKSEVRKAVLSVVVLQQFKICCNDVPLCPTGLQHKLVPLWSENLLELLTISFQTKLRENKLPTLLFLMLGFPRLNWCDKFSIFLYFF